MNRNVIKTGMALCLGAAMCFLGTGMHSESQAAAAAAATGAGSQTAGFRELGSALRLGYCQGESYYEFDEQFYYLVKGMEEYGLIPEVTEAGGFDEKVQSRELWQFLCSQNQEGWKVQFLPEAYMSLDAALDNGDGEVQAAKISSVAKKQKVDLLIIMGTRAGIAAKEASEKTPFMNFMAADPVGSGIVMDMGTSGIPGVWAQVDPDNFSRSISVMYDTFHPGTVGVVCADNEEAYIYSGARELEQFCQEKEVGILQEYVEDTFEEKNYREYVENLRSAHEKLASRVDVFILTTSLLEERDYPYVLEPFNEAGVPVYSINSVVDVEYGALMAAESSDYQNIGRFGADTIGRFLKGEKLEELNQVYQTAPFLVLNYTTAKRIGYQPDFTMLCSCSRIYH